MSMDEHLLNPDQIKLPENRPGLTQIAYRISDYAAFRQRLIAALPNSLRPQDGQPAPLAGLTTRAEDDPAIALLDAWAVVADVLTFYQERIANEGYLRTATERQSVLELVRAIGYELSPGVAASTFLSFTVEEAPGSPDVVTVPQGTQIISVPVKDELPQIFETSQDFIAHRNWNALTPRSSRPQAIRSDTKQLYLSGTSTQLQAGDFVLLIDQSSDRVSDRTYLLNLTQVKPDAAANHTLIEWIALSAIESQLRQPKLLAFCQSAALFGNNAPAWSIMPAEVKLAALEKQGQPIQGGVFRSEDNGQNWTALSTGLPSEDITCLVARDKVVIAGTSQKGIFRSTDKGQTWTAANIGVTNLQIHALYWNGSNQQGPLLAGTSAGGVFRSKDGGENWVPINIGSVRVEAKGPQNWESVNTSLPNTVVRSLVIYPDQPAISSEIRVSSTDRTVTVTAPNQATFQTLPELRVNSAITAAGQTRIVTAINNGTLNINKPFRNNLPDGTSFVIGGSYLFVGTDDGVFLSADQGKNWEAKHLSDRAVYSLLVLENPHKGRGTFISKIQAESDIAFIRPGDRITVAGQTRNVEEVSGKELKLNQLFSGSVSGLPFEITRQGTREISSATCSTLVGIGTQFSEELIGSSVIRIADQIRTVTVISDCELTVNVPFTQSFGNGQAFQFQLLQSRANLAVAENKVTIFDRVESAESIDRRPAIGDLLILEAQSGRIQQIDLQVILSLRAPSDSPSPTPPPTVTIEEQEVLFISEQQIILNLATSNIQFNAGSTIRIGTQNRTIETVEIKTIFTVEPSFSGMAASNRDFKIFRAGTGIITNAIAKSAAATFISNDLKVGDRFVIKVPIEGKPDKQISRVVTAVVSDTLIGLDSPLPNDDLSVNRSYYIQRRGFEPLIIAEHRLKIQASNQPNVGDIIAIDHSGQIMNRTVTKVISAGSEQVLEIDAPFNSPISNQTSFSIGGIYIFAGTDAGIYRSSDLGESWEAINSISDSTNNIESPNSLLSQRTVYTLVHHQTEELLTLFAGTDAGVYRSSYSDQGQIWNAINATSDHSDLSSHAVRSLAVSSDSVFAGTDHGIFVLENSAEVSGPWKFVSSGTVQDFTAVAFDIAGHTADAAKNNTASTLFAGSRFIGFTPAEVKPETTTETILAGSQSSGSQSQGEWPNFQIQNWQQIDLDTLYPQILPSSWIVLLNDRDPANPEKKIDLRFAARQVKTAIAINRSDFGLSGKVTRIEPTETIDPTAFGLRSTVVLARSEELPLAPEPLTVSDRQYDIFNSPIQDQTIYLSEFIPQLQPNQKLIVSGQRIRIQLNDIGGVFRSEKPFSESAGRTIRWRSSNNGLVNSQVRSLVQSQDGTLLLAGTTEGLFRSSDQGLTWAAIFTWTEASQSLKHKAIQALLIKEQSGQLALFVATAEGLFRSQDQGNTWKKLNLPYPNIRTIALNEKTLLAGTNEKTLLVGTIEGGLFQSLDHGDTWTATGLNMTDVQALTMQPRFSSNNLLQVLYAGTLQGGVFRSTDGGSIWQQLTQIRSGTGSISSNGNLMTGNGTQFATQLQVGDTINAAEQTRTVMAIDSSESSTQTITINAPFRPDLLPNTEFTINTGLESSNITALVNGTRIGQGMISAQSNQISGHADLKTGQNTAFTTTLKIGDRLTVADNTRTVTQIISDQELTIDQAVNFSETAPFLINDGLIFAGTAGSGVFRSWDRGDRWEQVVTNLSDLEIRCLTLADNGEVWVGTAKGGAFRSLDNGSTWIPVGHNLTNLDIRAILLPSLASDSLAFNSILQPIHYALIGGIGILRSPDQLTSTLVQRQDCLEILEPPVLLPADIEATADRYWQLKLIDHAGAVGLLTTEPAAVTLLPAASDSEVISEVVTIQDPPTEQQLPLLTFQQPLQHSYDPATVKIYANVVEATQGETVEEVLGSGDGNAAHQRFALRKPPLTYVPAATASGAASTLQIRVNGVLWQEAASLYTLTAQDQNYVIQIADDGTTTVTFGDGNKGARLLTGEENVTATYRSGMGLDGNVGVGSLSVLKTRPLGISDVINPLAATGAAASESRELARNKAPATVKTLERIVSLQDFEDFARGFAGIGKAQAIALWAEETQWVYITIAGIDGAAVPEESALYQKLMQAIDRARDPIQQVQVSSYERILFNLEARILLDPRYEAEQIEAQVLPILKHNFAFEQRDFEQPVTASEVIAAIQPVTGVVAVDLDALYQAGTSKVLKQSLTALPVRYVPPTIHPAQLLLINPKGIQLSFVSTF